MEGSYFSIDDNDKLCVHATSSVSESWLSVPCSSGFYYRCEVWLETALFMISWAGHHRPLAEDSTGVFLSIKQDWVNFVWAAAVTSYTPPNGCFLMCQGFDRSGGNRIVLLHTVDVETTFANRSKMNMFISTIKSSSISSVVKEHRLWTQLRHITRWFMKCCLEAFTWAFPQSLSLCLKSDVISKSSDLTVYLHLHWLMPKPWIIPFSKRINKIVLSFI